MSTVEETLLTGSLAIMASAIGGAVTGYVAYRISKSQIKSQSEIIVNERWEAFIEAAHNLLTRDDESDIYEDFGFWRDGNELDHILDDAISRYRLVDTANRKLDQLKLHDSSSARFDCAARLIEAATAKDKSAYERALADLASIAGS